jgi:predicted membrane chloride channel (bestrophin family)
MIDYYKGIYNINLLLRIHGSSLYKSSLIGLVGVAIYFIFTFRGEIPMVLPITDDDLDHPYGVGVLVSSVGFLIVFRANYSYQRYWSSCSALQSMLSKWGDSCMNTAVFAMQNKKWDGRKPRNFYDFEELNKYNLTRDRSRHDGRSRVDEKVLKSVYDCEKVRTPAPSPSNKNSVGSSPLKLKHRSSWELVPETSIGASEDIMQRLAYNFDFFPSSTEHNHNFAFRPDGRTPPLFLQELAHRTSLLSAVALSTLRNDAEGYESPLDIYYPGAPLPEVDPDKVPKDTRQSYQPNTIKKHCQYWFSIDRTPVKRSEYNSSRPLSVIGGVSDAEIVFLQKARGSYAKTQLAWCWLSELIVRSHLDGTLGDVHAAILSRLFQNLSDGMKEYNRARQIIYIPFPFPHAQLSVFYTFILVPVIPFLMDQFTNVRWVGTLLTFLAVTCLVGLHEVARELENPFRNVPNELPICTIQAAFNEGLLVMFAGYNPDSFWDGEGWLNRGRESRKSNGFGALNNGQSAPSSAKPYQPHSNNFRPSPKNGHFVSSSQCARELRDILEKQAKDIEELSSLLDAREKTE